MKVKWVTVKIPQPLAERARRYQERNPDVWGKDLDDLVCQSLEYELDMRLNSEDDQLQEKIWPYLKENNPIPGYLMRQVEAYYVEAKKRDQICTPDLRAYYEHAQKNGWQMECFKMEKKLKEAGIDPA